jgi:hypothetical protein
MGLSMQKAIYPSGVQGMGRLPSALISPYKMGRGWGKIGFSKSLNPEIRLSGKRWRVLYLTSSALSYPIEQLGNVLTKFTDKP